MKKFEEGDKVWHPRFGNGIIRFVFEDDNRMQVNFTNSGGVYDDCYRLDGRYFKSDLYPSIYPGHNLKMEVKEKEKCFVNLFWNVGKSDSVVAGKVYATKEEALGNTYFAFQRYIKTVEVIK